MALNNLKNKFNTRFVRFKSNQILILCQKMEKQKNKIPHEQKYTVSVRIRPKIKQSEQTVFIPYKNQFVKELKAKSILTYSFDNVFDETHENQFIFERSIKQKVQRFLKKGVNTTILAYGQTGSGKTHTLFGHKSSGQKGLVHHIIGQVMNQCNQKGLKVTCTFLQIYKQKVTDLLSGNDVTLRDNAKGELVLDGNRQQSVSTIDELQSLLLQANKNKIFGNSYINSQSSRSHVLFNIELEGAYLNILDLCGNEVLTYKFDQKQRAQTNSINLSLFTLNSVISDLCQKGENKFIPFRNSVLTRLLKKSLIDEQKTQVYLFCNISPEKQHQQFSSSTLRFGQLAIEIDQKDNIVEQKVNLSQKKRDLKKVSNIIEVEAKKSSKFYHLPEPWEVSQCNILKKNTTIYRLQKSNAKVNILLLHAYGGGCDGTDWNNFAYYLIKYLDCNLYSVDFPGFGRSQGQKFTSRSEKFHEKDQPIEFMAELFKEFKFSKLNPVYLMGYDLGGAIALRLGMEPKFSKAISGIITLHPTWTDKIQKLSVIENEVLLLWFPVQTFHLISAGQKMSKVIKNSLLYKFNIGHYTNQKGAGYYDWYYEQVSEKIINFIQEQMNKDQKEQSNEASKKRGKMIQEIIEIKVNKEEQKCLKIQQAVKEIYEMINAKEQEKVFDAITKGGENKPKFIKLVGNLPSFKPQNISWELLKKYQIIENLPQNLPKIDKIPFLTPGRQINVRSKINMSVFSGVSNYLAYDQKSGQLGITHKAYVSQSITEEIIEQGQVPVKIKCYESDSQQQTFKQILVDLGQVIQINCQTNFKKNVLGHTVFEDNVTCNYDSNVMKLLFIKICFSIRQIFSHHKEIKNNSQWLSIQHQVTQTIFKVMDLRHLVHQGIDNTRYTGTDVGRLAYYGQGNCHHLASTLAALLLPFGKIFGWEVIFRAGSFFLTGRQLDQNGNPLPKWNGKPNVNVEDHTWLQIVYKPSNKIFVFDPSFSICNVELDLIYSFKGKMHISGKPLNFAYPPMTPGKLI